MLLRLWGFWRVKTAMFETVEDILPLERMRFELRFPDGDTSLDNNLRAQIASAVSTVAIDTHLPFPNRLAAQTFRADGNTPIAFRDPFFRSISSITYQAPSPSPIPAFFPDTVPEAAYNMTVEEGEAVVIVPAERWPDTANGLFRVTGVYGLPDTYTAKDSLTVAAVFLVRDFYDGIRSLPKIRAYDRIISPLRHYAPWRFEIVG